MFSLIMVLWGMIHPVALAAFGAYAAIATIYAITKRK